MKLHFYGGAKSVTGANYLLETDNGTKLIIEVGMFQGSHTLENLNFHPFHYNTKEIDAVFITHSHLDHCGRVPRLVRKGYKGPIYCTHPTRDIMEPSLLDSAKISKQQARRMGYPPLYEPQDVRNMLRMVQAREFHEKFKVTDDVEARFQEAGHILGSAIIELFITENGTTKKVVFTGDLGNPPTPLLKPTTYVHEADYVIIESAYGNRNHEKRTQRKQILKEILLDAINRKSTVLIPSFAIERTQELLFELNDFVENKKIPRTPVFIDSPLAIKIVKAYRKNQRFFNYSASKIIQSGDDIFHFPRLKFTNNVRESKNIASFPDPKIIIAGSGMSTGGRILNHEKRYLSNPNTTVLIIGFQVDGTLGRKIFNKDPVVTIDGERIIHRAQVKAIGGYSAHADQDGLTKFISKIDKKKPQKVFVVQGDADASTSLAARIEEELKIPAIVPDHESVFEL